MTKHRGFYITSKHGFHVVFENDWTVSVQFGPGNYCDHYDREIGRDSEACGKEGSTTAETAVWGPDGKMVDRGAGDTVQARQTPAQVLELLTWAAAQ